jgi:four helix bundle protein
MDYRELGFFQKARQVTKAVDQELRSWPRNIQAQEIAKQVFRAATSIGANIAEGHGRHTGQEYIHFLIIAQGSANEVDHWLNTALDCSIGDSERIRQILGLNLETRKMLSKAITSLRNQIPRSLHEPPAPYSPAPFWNNESGSGDDIL